MYMYHVFMYCVSADNSELKNILWRAVIIDEAHRLKNKNCKMLEGLRELHMVSSTCTCTCIIHVYTCTCISTCTCTHWCLSQDFVIVFGSSIMLYM